jgi:TPR repeat protein
MLYEQEENREESLRYYRLAAEKGDAEAQTRLALAIETYHPHLKTPENEEAFKWMKAAANQGHVEANYYLGNFYRDGTWVDADPQKALECYSKAAEQGNSDAMERVGGFYANGIAVPEDSHLAFQYFQRSAELGNPKGQCQLGFCYLQGIGCHQDMELAFQWISRAADSGHPVVMSLLESSGLDIAKLSSGYQQSRRLQSHMQGDYFGDVFEPILSHSPQPILPIPPGEKDTNS